MRRRPNTVGVVDSGRTGNTLPDTGVTINLSDSKQTNHYLITENRDKTVSLPVCNFRMYTPADKACISTTVLSPDD